MSQTVVKKRTGFNAKKITATVLGAIVLLISGVLIYDAATELFTAKKTRDELRTVQAELADLETQQEDLTGVREKLSDPTYVQNYARGAHLMSKSEEQVFVLPRPSGDE